MINIGNIHYTAMISKEEYLIIAGYLDKLNTESSDTMTTSHLRLRRLYQQHGNLKIDSIMNRWWMSQTISIGA